MLAEIRSAEIWLLPGEGHATDLFDHNPTLHLRLIDWMIERLGPYPAGD